MLRFTYIRPDRHGGSGIAPLLVLAATWRLSTPEAALLAVAAMPLVDGVFLSTVTSGALRSLAGVVGIGLWIFSGAGCVSIAAGMPGSLRNRVAAVGRVYLLVLLGAVATVLSAPIVTAVVTPDLHVYGAILLGSIAAALLGLPLAPRGSLPQRMGPRWLYCLRLVTVPEVVLAVMLAVSALRVLAHGVAFGGVAPPEQLRQCLAAVSLAFGLTLSAAVLAGVVQRWLDLRLVRATGGMMLLYIAARLLGAPDLPLLPVALVVLGFGAAITSGLRRAQG